MKQFFKDLYKKAFAPKLAPSRAFDMQIGQAFKAGLENGINVGGEKVEAPELNEHYIKTSIDETSDFFETNKDLYEPLNEEFTRLFSRMGDLEQALCIFGDIVNSMVGIIDEVLKLAEPLIKKHKKSVHLAVHAKKLRVRKKHLKILEEVAKGLEI